MIMKQAFAWTYRWSSRARFKAIFPGVAARSGRLIGLDGTNDP